MAEINGKKVLFSVHAHTSVPTDASEINYDNTQSGLEATDVQAAVDEVNEKKAEKDGNYEGMTVGLAENLVNDEGKTLDPDAASSSGSLYADQPFVQRATAIPFSGETVSVGNGVEEIKKEQAFSVVKNQYIFTDLSLIKANNTQGTWNDNVYTRNGITFTYNNGKVTVNGTSTDIAWLTLTYTLKKNSTYLIFGGVAGSSHQTYGFGSNVFGIYDNGEGTQINTANTETLLVIRVASGQTLDNVVFEPRAINLTDFFASRPAMANCAAQWFLQNYPEYTSVVPYNAGTIVDTEDYEYQTTGVNLWDEEWEVGGISDITGQDVTFNGIRSVGYSECFPSTDYYLYCGSTTNVIIVYFYDKNKAFIGTARNSSSFVFTTPANVCYFRIAVGATYGTTYKNDIQICNHFTETSVEQTYHKFEKHTKDVSWAFTSTGKGKSAGSVADTKDYVNKKNVEKVGKVDLGSDNVTWTYSTASQRFIGTLSGVKPQTNQSVRGNATCSKYQTLTETESSTDATLVGLSIGADGKIIVRDASYGTNVATFKAAMSGVILNYELATYIETDMTDEEANNTIEENDYGVERKVSTNANEIFSGSATTIFYQDNPLRQIYNNKDAIEELQSEVESKQDAMQDLSAQITDAGAGLSYVIKKAYKMGNLVFLTIRATNTGVITANTTLFTLASGLYNASGSMRCWCDISGTPSAISINTSGVVSCSNDIPNGSALVFNVAYAVA